MNNRAGVPAESDMHLVLFLSRATPLARWERMGIFEREVAIYRRLAGRLGRVSIVTSGGAEEQAYAQRLPGIRILHNRWGLSPNLYSVLAPVLHGGALREATLFKTNQLDGAWTAILSGMLHRKPVIARAGYLWAEDNRSEGGRGVKATLIDRLQRWTLRRANGIFLTTAAMKSHVAQRYAVAPERIHVVPNYVDTERFRPLAAGDAPADAFADELANAEKVAGRICYVGRLHPRKNLDQLIRAVGEVPGASLVLIGRGEQQPELEALAAQVGADVRFAGVVPHERIPAEMARAQLFVLASQFEGHPKALLEAMACGTAVIGSDVPGTREEIVHGETGWLCQPNAASIAEAVRTLLADTALRECLGRNARAAVVNQYSLDRVVDVEINAMQHVLASGKG